MKTTYLDDPDHEWILDPTSIDADAEQVITALLNAASNETTFSMDVILRGAAGLLQRGAGTPAQCLDTSMTWWYG
jgi:hypothetical protein